MLNQKYITHIASMPNNADDPTNWFHYRWDKHKYNIDQHLLCRHILANLREFRRWTNKVSHTFPSPLANLLMIPSILYFWGLTLPHPPEQDSSNHA